MPCTRASPSFNELSTSLTSGFCGVCRVVEHENACELADLIGATDPAKADEGTIRRRFGESLQCNAYMARTATRTHARWSQFFHEDDIITAEYR